MMMRRGLMLVTALGSALLSAAAPLAAQGAARPAATAAPSSTTRIDGLIPLRVDRQRGTVQAELPRPGADGVAGRYIYVTALETGLGSAAIGLDRGLLSGSRLVVFRRAGDRIVVEVENPRFRAPGNGAAEQAGVRDAFATSVLWVAPIASELPDGRLLVDMAPFLLRDDMNIASRLREQGANDWRLASDLSFIDAGAARSFAANVELEAHLTFTTSRAGPEVANVAPVPGNVSLTVRHSFVRLPEAGYQPRRFDPRAGSFGTQVIDYSQPLGAPIVYELANRFRLERVDPTAERSRVRRPITFYIDSAAPEPIRQALLEGVNWWREGFEAAGFIDAFRAEILPAGVDPMDLSHNTVVWVNRATRGWSYGQAIDDPRTGEIIAGRVLLGSLRVRQDMIIFQALVGANLTGTGDPNDPVTAALQRIRQLGAHEVGHALGLAHNFAASTQDRYSVMDYPAPRVGLRGGAPDLTDAYGNGLGRWDRFAIDWLYGARDDADGARRMEAGLAEGLRYVADDHARPAGAPHPQGSLWDDAADPVAELARVMEVRRVAVSRFGPQALPAGAPLYELRRSFVPIWLLHRYQVEAAAKLLGGVDFGYAVAGGRAHPATVVPGADQQRALTALLETLRPGAQTVPANLLPSLSAGWSGGSDRQFEIEAMRTAGDPVFDPMVATETGTALTLASLIQPLRLNRLEVQSEADGTVPSPAVVIDRLLAQVFDFNGLSAAEAGVQRRIATTTVLALARLQRDASLSPTLSLALSERLARLGATLARGTGGNADWSRGLARLLADREALERAAADESRVPRIPPGMPIGSED